MTDSEVDKEREREITSDEIMLIILSVHSLDMQEQNIYFALAGCEVVCIKICLHMIQKRESKIERGEREREGWREKTRRRERGDSKGG